MLYNPLSLILPVLAVSALAIVVGSALLQLFRRVHWYTLMLFLAIGAAALWLAWWIG